MTVKRNRKGAPKAAKVAKPKKTVRDLASGEKADDVKGGASGQHIKKAELTV